MMKTIRATGNAALLSILLAVFWIALVADVHLHELLLGIPAVAGTVAFSLFAIRTMPIRFSPEIRDLLEVVWVPAYVVVDSAVVTLVLVLDLMGWRAPTLFRATTWRMNSDHPRDLARRTLAVAYTTASPNCVVIGIDRRQRRILFHQLKRTPLPAMTRRLGAGSTQ